MISVMTGFEIERKPATSVTATADHSFLVMENLQEGARVSDGGYSGVSSETRVSYRVDLAGKMPDLENRVSGKGEQMGSGSLEEELMMKIDGSDEDIVYMDEENRLSFLESSGWMHVFRIGDMVWGKVKSHPWWPGHIFNEAFASPSVRRMGRDGLVLVAFFGDSSYGWFDPAELIPFEPHFSEKSRQTTSRSFVKAVEEAVDEASRRGALAVACCCRNQQNFRPTTVAGYFSVDVVGYEPGGIYSSRQIKKSRDSLVPAELLSFVQQLALTACGRDDNSIEWIQTIAKLLAYRKAVFEEFDETYAQAFGVDPVRPSSKSMGAFDQTDRFAPRGAPLSGPLVVAETLAERRSSTRQASQKPTNIGKKNKYVLKRRDDLPAASPSSSFPDIPSASQPLHHGLLPSLPDSTDPPASFMDFNYVLQKREKLSPPSDVFTGLQSTTEASLPQDFAQKSEPVEVKNEAGSSESILHAIHLESSQEFADKEYQKPPLQVRDDIAVVKEKAPKRPREDFNQRGEAKKKKKKKKAGLGADRFPASFEGDQRRLVAGRSIGLVELLPQEDGIDMELPSGLELSSLQLPELVSDLSSVALDPFYAIERDAPAIVRHVFLRFRSLVYQKSLILPPSIETAAPAQPLSADIGAAIGREGRKHRESFSSWKPPKAASRLGDSTKAVRKRDPSDRQEELSMKKMEKMNQLKQLASKKKKVAMSQKNPELQQSTDLKDSTSSATATEASKKQEPPPAPKPPSPTFLVMKFPPRSTLPSATNLKARFARFGPLDLSGTRISWKNHTCKVLFKHKSNAQSAFNFVQSNDLFGQVKVIYSLRDLEISGPDQPLDTQIKPSDSSRLEKDSLQYLHGSAIIQKPSFSQVLQSQTQLKSILKKPVVDESGSSCATATNSITKESPRVKFMLNGNDDRIIEPPPPKLVTISNDGGGQAPLLSSVDQISRQPPKSIGFFSPPLLQPLQPPSRGLEMHSSRIPPPSPAALQQTLLPPPPPQMLPPRPPPQHSLPLPQPRGVHFHLSRGLLPPLAPSNEPRERMTVDISGPMLSLLLKCNDIVSNLKSSLGYNPYHSL
ncbi:hypothetical protein IEQ34_010408 [Dendrobium chrysotoxum]|uniref:PWWP domain-containing protein n=1 Tax=Dendrobium chrysotoxum TaxID=161865 RepID=A0AAV7H5K2_DENCH|nr:hypothetical protein IEQ34_010408 [Dendrobium chrysotoxum]